MTGGLLPSHGVNRLATPDRPNRMDLVPKPAGTEPADARATARASEFPDP